MGFYLQYGLAGDQNVLQAFNHYREAAEHGSASGAVNVGRLFRNGVGVAKSIEEAIAWYHKASAMTDPETLNSWGQLRPEAAAVAGGFFELGHIYENGDDVGEDGIAAQRYYRQGAAVEKARRAVT